MALDMLHYIGEQPEKLALLLRGREEYGAAFTKAWRELSPDRLYLIGSGTSGNAAAAAAPFMERVLGVETTAACPSALPIIRGLRPLILLISQGGNSTNTLFAAEKLSQYPVIALTGTSDCRLNALCARRILIPCGPEEAGPKTKGYVSTIMHLYIMALEVARAQGRDVSDTLSALSDVVSAMPGNIARVEKWVDENSQWLMDTPSFVIVGKRQAGIVAREAALKLVETILAPAISYEFEEYLHGPTALINESLGGVYLLPEQSDPDYRRMLAVAGVHGTYAHRVLAVSSDGARADGVISLEGGGAEYTAPFVEILPCQMIAAKLPARMNLGDRGNEIFRRIDNMVDVKYGHKA